MEDERRSSRSSALPYILFVVVILGFGMAVAGLMRGADDGPASLSGKKVGVLELKGVIMDTVPLVRALEDLVHNDKIAAILLRVDSPGGAVGPSQELYEAIAIAREKKPVVISMGTVAASGGMYVAAAGDYILANPGTLTGSIGVIMQFTDFSELMDWAKVDVQVVKTGQFKDAGAAYRPLTDVEQAYFQELADQILNQFVVDVQRGRTAAGVSEAVVGPVADGRVLSGEQALELGLVDQLGGFAVAVSKAAELGGIEGRPKLHRPRVGPTWIERMLEDGIEQRLSEYAARMVPLWALWVP